MREDTNRMSEASWRAMASSIIGSGSYALRGDDRGQIEVLVQWLRQGKDQGFDWATTYEHIHASWAKHRPLLPSPDEMARLVASPNREDT